MPAPSSGHQRRWLLPAAVLFAAVALWAAGGASAAETLQEKFDSTQGKLDQVRKSEHSLSATIAVKEREAAAEIGRAHV